MVEIFKKRMTAKMDSEFVVFLIGMRVNKFWKLHKWLPVAMAMSKMLPELYKNPQLGFISQESWVGRTTIMLQYWKSFEHLESYAKSKTAEHLPAWAAFNKNVASNGDVGIWHETYMCKPGSYECVYNNMPRFALAKAGEHVPISERSHTASARIKNTT